MGRRTLDERSSEEDEREKENPKADRHRFRRRRRGDIRIKSFGYPAHGDGV